MLAGLGAALATVAALQGPLILLSHARPPDQNRHRDQEVLRAVMTTEVDVHAICSRLDNAPAAAQPTGVASWMWAWRVEACPVRLRDKQTSNRIGTTMSVSWKSVVASLTGSAVLVVGVSYVAAASHDGLVVGRTDAAQQATQPTMYALGTGVITGQR